MTVISRVFAWIRQIVETLRDKSSGAETNEVYPKAETGEKQMKVSAQEFHTAFHTGPNGFG